MLLTSIGQRLRERRQEMSLTQAALAARTGLSLRFLVQLESGQGNISVQRLAQVCEALTMTLESLFGGLGPKGPYQRVTLVGLRGAGKSTIGRCLSARLGIPFVELDERIVAEAGLSLKEVFDVGGSELYRDLELRMIETLMSESGSFILAAGGSVVTSSKSWRLLREHTRTVWLKAAPQSHLDRVSAQGDLRPMAGRSNVLRELTEILETRVSLYAMSAHTIDTEGVDEDDVVDRVSAVFAQDLHL